MTSRQTLLEMGFAPTIVDQALKHHQELGAAIDWIDAHPDGEPIAEPEQPAPAVPAHAAPETDSAEAPTDSRPVSERLAEMQERAAVKRKEREKQDTIDRRNNDLIAKKNLEEAREARRELEIKQAQKAADARRKAAREDKLYKQKLRDQIEQDKRDRAARSGASAPPAPSAAKPAAQAPAPAPAAAPTSVRLRVTYKSESTTKNYPLGTTVSQLGSELGREYGLSSVVLTTAYPKATIDPSGDSRTLREAGLANASITVTE